MPALSPHVLCVIGLLGCVGAALTMIVGCTTAFIREQKENR